MKKPRKELLKIYKRPKGRLTLQGKGEKPRYSKRGRITNQKGAFGKGR